jgi:hypothetical protein
MMWVIGCGLFVGYIISQVPVSYAMVRCHAHQNSVVKWSCITVYAPLHWLGAQSPWINAGYQAQWNWLNQTFGDVNAELRAESGPRHLTQ